MRTQAIARLASRRFQRLCSEHWTLLSGLFFAVVLGVALWAGLYDFIGRGGLRAVVVLLAIICVIGSILLGLACVWIRLAEAFSPQQPGRRSSIGRRSVTAAYPPYWDTALRTADDAPPHQLLYTDAEAHAAVQDLVAETFLPICTQDRVCPRGRCPMTPGGCQHVRPGGDPGMPTKLEVLTVIRVEDPQSWEQYMTKREQIREDMFAKPCFKEMDPPIMTGSCAENTRSCVLEPLEDELQEAYLWHGTPVRKALSIARSNFDLKAPGHRRVAYGHGIYLAECSSKADEYSRDDSELQVEDGHYDGIFAMLLCRVCLGRPYYTVSRDQNAAERCVEDGFHSTCGDRAKSAGTYREFVVYSTEQVLPEYIVLYKRVYGAGMTFDRATDSIVVRNDIQPVVFPAFYCELPVYWDNCWQDLRVESFEQSEAVGIATLKLFNDLISRHVSGAWRIAGMRRIENSELWRHYVTAKGKLPRAAAATTTDNVVVDSTLPHRTAISADSLLPSAMGNTLDPSVNECLLWHTTSPEASESILSGGFRIKPTAVRSRFGQGVYFSHDLNKSLEYGTRGSVAARCVLLCRVACGEAYYTEADREDDADEVARRLGKASVLANPGGTGPSEVVILQQEQAYPEFALTLLQDAPS